MSTPEVGLLDLSNMLIKNGTRILNFFLLEKIMKFHIFAHGS
jgi:hypothetical protein